MIKFFRKIRQNLLSEGKTGKYFKYAIGEIVLVVLGILIALSINNWNDSRKNKTTESEYYCKLLADFNLDRKNIAKLYKESQNKIETSKELLLELDQMEKSKSHLIDRYIQALRTNVFVPSKVTISDIVSSGNMNLIRNEALKNALIRYYAELDKYLYQLEINRIQTLEKAFAYNSEIQLGYQFADYARESLGEDILKILPVNNWHLDKEDEYYQQFQNDLVFFVIMSEREKQHFDNILVEQQTTYRLLKTECRQLD